MKLVEGLCCLFVCSGLGVLFLIGDDLFFQKYLSHITAVNQRLLIIVCFISLYITTRHLMH